MAVELINLTYKAHKATFPHQVRNTLHELFFHFNERCVAMFKDFPETCCILLIFAENLQIMTRNTCNLKMFSHEYKRLYCIWVYAGVNWGFDGLKTNLFSRRWSFTNFYFCVDQKSEMSDTTWQCLNIRPYMNKTLLKNYKLDWTQNCINKYTSTRLTLNTFTIPHCFLQAWTLLRMFHNQFNES